MRKVETYKSFAEAIELLDNGGRFYNILTKEDDGVIERSELSKVAGLFSDKQKMILFFQLSISDLTKQDQELLVSKFSTRLKDLYNDFKPVEFDISDYSTIRNKPSNLIVKGIPKLVDKKSNFHGFITIPISTGKITTFSMIPIIEIYDVYEILDENNTKLIVAHSQTRNKLPEKMIKIAGNMKDLREDKRENVPSLKYLEVAYYADFQ